MGKDKRKARKFKYTFLYATRNDNYSGRPIDRLQASLRALHDALEEFNLRAQSEIVVVDWCGAEESKVHHPQNINPSRHHTEHNAHPAKLNNKPIKLTRAPVVKPIFWGG